MAAPTPKTQQRQIGKQGFIMWNAVWANGDNMTDVAVIDLSAASEGHTNNLAILKVEWLCTAGIEFTLEFDDDGGSDDEFILTSTLGSVTWGKACFTEYGCDGAHYLGSGGTGDLVITTTSAASADEVTLMIYYRVD